VMVDFVKCLYQVNGAQIGSFTAAYNVINSTTSHPNGMAATSTFLKTKLASRCSKQRLKSFKYAMFNDFGYNRADGNTPEIVASERLITALTGFGNRNSIAVSESNRNIGTH